VQGPHEDVVAFFETVLQNRTRNTKPAGPEATSFEYAPRWWDTSTPAAKLQKAAAKIVSLKTFASAEQVIAAAGALAPHHPVGQPSLAEMFKLKPGEWECAACMTRNKAAAKVKCASCHWQRL
jgi:hypothetical protein